MNPSKFNWKSIFRAKLTSKFVYFYVDCRYLNNLLNQGIAQGRRNWGTRGPRNFVINYFSFNELTCICLTICQPPPHDFQTFLRSWYVVPKTYQAHSCLKPSQPGQKQGLVIEMDYETIATWRVDCGGFM